jgi:hypothetical protein
VYTVDTVRLIGTSEVDTIVELAGQFTTPGEHEVMVAIAVLYIVELTTPTALEVVSDVKVIVEKIPGLVVDAVRQSFL